MTVALVAGLACVATAPPGWAADAPAVGAAASDTSADDDSDSDSPESQRWAVHAQATVIEQGNASFPSPYRGEYSLDPSARGRETVNATVFLGASPWQGAQIWVNPGFEQGLALSDARGVAGYLDAEAPRGGSSGSYGQIQRLFLSQTIDLGGKTEHVDGDENVLAGTQKEDRVVLTVGKFAVGDIFDANDYAGDSEEDFLNASVVVAGSFDFAGDYTGYTYGAATEFYQGPWTLRLGVFDLTGAADDGHLDSSFGQFQMVGEVERRFAVWGQPGSLKLTAFDSRARLGTYADAVREGLLLGTVPDVRDVQSYRNRAGVSFDLQQQISDDLGFFARAGWADGQVQSYEFADIDRSFSGGLVLDGNRWEREDDAIGLALAVNGISSSFVSYLDHGGLGLAIGDGRLPHPGTENIVETFYRWSATDEAHVTFDYQFVDNPAYNRDRGPVSVFAIRVHVAL